MGVALTVPPVLAKNNADLSSLRNAHSPERILRQIRSQANTRLPEQKLWMAFLEQVISELALPMPERPIRAPGTRRYAWGHITNSYNERVAAIESAKQFVASSDFNRTCEWLDLEPEWVLKLIVGIGKQATQGNDVTQVTTLPTHISTRQHVSAVSNGSALQAVTVTRHLHVSNP